MSRVVDRKTNQRNRPPGRPIPGDAPAARPLRRHRHPLAVAQSRAAGRALRRVLVGAARETARAPGYTPVLTVLRLAMMDAKPPVDVDGLFAEMERLYPEPPGYQPDHPDTTDRRAMQQYIATKLRRERLQLTDHDLACMYGERSTGLRGLVIYCSPRGSSEEPRVKVVDAASGLQAAISIDDQQWREGRDNLSEETRSRVEQWVRTNKTCLLQFWSGEIDDDSAELARRFVKP